MNLFTIPVLRIWVKQPDLEQEHRHLQQAVTTANTTSIVATISHAIDLLILKVSWEVKSVIDDYMLSEMVAVFFFFVQDIAAAIV